MATSEHGCLDGETTQQTTLERAPKRPSDNAALRIQVHTANGVQERDQEPVP